MQQHATVSHVKRGSCTFLRRANGVHITIVMLGSKLSMFPLCMIASFILIVWDNVDDNVMQDTCSLLPDDVPRDAYCGSSYWRY